MSLMALFARLVRPAGPSALPALAVSGGSDSTALMVLFADWLRQGRPRALAAYGADGRPWAARCSPQPRRKRVAAQAAALGFRHATLVWDGPKPHAGIQAAARAARYRLMGDYMRANGITAAAHGAHARRSGRDAADAPGARQRTRRAGRHGARLSTSPSLGRFAILASDEPGIARPLLGVPKARLRRHARGARHRLDRGPEQPVAGVRAAAPACGPAQLDALGLTDAMLALSATTACARAPCASSGPSTQFCSPERRRRPASIRAAMSRSTAARLQAAEEEIALRVLGRAIAAAGGSGSSRSRWPSSKRLSRLAFRPTARNLEMDPGARHDHRQETAPSPSSASPAASRCPSSAGRGRAGAVGMAASGSRSAADFAGRASSRCSALGEAAEAR